MFTHNVMLFNKYIHQYDSIKDSNLTIEDIDPRIKKRRDRLPTISEDDDKWHSEHQAISINGYWYDIGNFIPSHPGGDIIKQYIRKDATTSFYGMHCKPDEILKQRFPCAIHMSSKPYVQKNFKLNELYWKLYQRYNELGLFTPSILWVVKVHILQAIMCAVMCWCCYYYPKNWFFNGIICGNFMVNAAFISHDSCHNVTTQNRSVNKFISLLNGTLCFGVFHDWWYVEHNMHHAMPNTYSDEEGRIVDPQSCEDLWAQADQVLGFYKAIYHPWTIPYQHIITFPLALFFGRFGIMVDGWAQSFKELRYKHILGLVLHWTWIIALCCLMESYWRFYFILHTYYGLLSLQLLSSHIAKPFQELEEAKEMSFPKRQAEVNVNFRCSRWNDWFFGGLHYHTEHHVFPRMPRYNLR